MFRLLVVSPSFASCSMGLMEELKNMNIEVKHVRPKWKLREEDFTGIIEDADGLIVGADIVSRKVMEMAPRLKIISKHGVGLDNIDLDAAKEFGIKVCYAAGSNTVAVAELACAMIMALARGLVINTQEIAAGRWNRQRGIELTGSTLGVVGTGAIGREVIRRMRAFGMKILAYDSFPDTKLISTIGGRYVELEELLCCSDFVSLHLPLTEDTRNLIDEQQIDKMKQGAYLINTARGGIVNEAALYKALKTGKIAGAGIDTFVDEPPFSSPLTKLNNVVMTPHIGGYTKEAIDKMSRAAAANIVQHIMEMKGLKSE